MVSVAGAGLDRALTTVPFTDASSVDIAWMPESIRGQITLLSHQSEENQRDAKAVDEGEGWGPVEVTQQGGHRTEGELIHAHLRSRGSASCLWPGGWMG